MKLRALKWIKQYSGMRWIVTDSVLFFFLSTSDFIEIRCPQGQIVTQKLHDGGWVTILILFQSVQVCNSIIEGLLGELARDVGTVQDLIVEDWVVKGQAQANGVRRLKRLRLCDCLTVAILCFLDDLLAPIIKIEKSLVEFKQG